MGGWALEGEGTGKRGLGDWVLNYWAASPILVIWL